MKVKTIITGTILSCLLGGFSSCTKESEEETIPVGPVNVAKIEGFAQKGPFRSDNPVTVYELDEGLKETDKTFTTETNKLGFFTLEPGTEFITPFVKVVVDGDYLNEITGSVMSEIELEALASLDKGGTSNINVNILTHLEIPRVVHLMIRENKSFAKAKQQAQKELLAAFLITKESVQPEKANIEAKNTASEILIAISSIILNERSSDSEIVEFINRLRNDLIDGSITEETRAEIAKSSYGLSYSKVKKNIIEHYESYGKEISIGNFERFIDGDNDGMIGDPYEEWIEVTPVNPITPEEFFKTEENFRKAMTTASASLFTFSLNQYILDGLYTQTVPETQFSESEFKEIFAHQLTASNPFIKTLWRDAYKNVFRYNVIIDFADEITADWGRKYSAYARTFRAQTYLAMINLWGDVPLVVRSSNETFPRTSQHEVLDFIIRELEEAAPFLPEASDEYECSKYYAWSLLARAYSQKGDYGKALHHANQVINSGKFSLSTNYSAIFSGGSQESVLELPINVHTASTYPNLIRKGEMLSHFRYAEVLLIAAEASWKSGKTAEALTLLNQVRSRNGRAAIQTASDIQDALAEEWIKDLKNEGWVFATYKRVGIAKQKLDLSDTGLLLPIPQMEIDLNPKMTQNPGY